MAHASVKMLLQITGDVFSSVSVLAFGVKVIFIEILFSLSYEKKDVLVTVIPMWK